MVAYLGDIATAVAAGGVGNKVLSGLIDGRVKVMVETYTILGTELSASTLAIGKALPIGANVLAIGVSVSAAQTSLTASFGDAGSATRYGSALTGLQTANSLVWVPGKNYVVTGTSDTQILITTGGATASAAALKAFIIYAID